MKKSLTSLMIALMAIALFSSCKKDDDSENPSVMSAQNVINSNSDIVTVKAMMWSEITDDPEIIATTSYNNNGFKLTLKTPPESCLYKITDEFELEYGIDISDPNAKVGDAFAIAFDNSGEEIGEFYQMGMNTRYYAGARYVYADRNFTMKGKVEDDGYDYVEEFNCSFKKCWNILYFLESNFENYSLVSTQKPSEVALEWIFEDYKCCKSNQHQSLFQKHEHAKKF